MPRKSDKPRDPTQIVALQIRIKEELRAQIEEAAAASGNSMNSEIADRLSSSLRDDAILGSGSTRHLMARIAGDIALIESRTGKLWTEDLATFEAARLTIEDTIKRQRPPRENYAEAMALLERENADLARENLLQKSLQKCGALEWRQVNSLLAMSNPEMKPYLAEAEVKMWRNPEAPEADLTDDDRAAIRSALDEYQALRSRFAERLEHFKKLREPIEQAEREGAEIHAAISQEIYADAIDALEMRDGA